MQINKIIKLAIKRLEREGKILTPDFYAEAFCKEAKLAGVKIDDCSHVQKMLQTLNPDLKKELRNYRIQTLTELTRFLIAKLNRTNKTHCSELLEAQSALNSAILKAISKLHNIEAKLLAKKSLELLRSNPTKAELEYFKQLWDNFVNSYDDTFLYKLKEFGTVDTDNLKKTIENLKITPQQEQQGVDLEKIATLLINSLVPSISTSSPQKIERLRDRLKKDPTFLLHESIQDEIKEAVSARIALDKKSVKQMIASLENILDKLSMRLIGMIEKSDGSTVEIQRIKRELEDFTKTNEINFQLAHKQLYTIATALEENTLEFKSDLQDHSDEVKTLQKRVKELENELKKAQQEAKIDFLTKLYNKRALDEFLQLKEGEFKRYGRNYSIVMFDIDHFKKVNDTYGHDAGDIVLRSFASILKKDSRNVDIIGRFGGEEFMALLGETDLNGAAQYAKKVNEHVKRAKFIYKGERIPLTVSAGVAQRKDNLSLEATIEKADANLYKAKNGGRDQVVFK
ncbi:FIG00469765: hypothetical protein [hydrothermal vent metagenome]|uniref:GGDEF domain-containing protein n=1 Tax=hydrothermal vent metagenome TaxID=652676 RepID=A0A1W1BAX3_9ZZZZ